MKAIFKSSLAALGLVLAPADSRAEPWQWANPAPSWTAVVAREVQAYGEQHKPTAVMIVHNGRAIASWGEIGRKVNVRSVRKSLLSALYGIAVSDGRIDLASTLGQLGIDDKPPSLTDAEKQATVRQLLMARSGVYHPAAYESKDMTEKRPARGSHLPGSFWYYNNWDFNALGTIYQKATGEDIFQSFKRRIAGPTGMEDFSDRDGRYVSNADSVHAAYPFTMTARDLARFGQLILDGGRWNGAQVVPGEWITQSTTSYSQTDRGDRGYGYCWWVLPPERWGAGAAVAAGHGGQVVAVIPAKRLVLVQTLLISGTATGIRGRDTLDLLQKIVAAIP